MREIAAAFNSAHTADGVRVDMVFFSDFQYTEKISIAAAARDLPVVFDLDGPLVARLVDGGLLQLIDHWFPADFLPNILEKGTIGGHLFDPGIVRFRRIDAPETTSPISPGNPRAHQSGSSSGRRLNRWRNFGPMNIVVR